MEVSIKTFYENTAASLMQLSRVQRVNFRGSQTGIIQHLRSQNIKVKSVPAVGRPGAASPGMSIGVGGRPSASGRTRAEM